MLQVGQLPRIIAWCTVNETLNCKSCLQKLCDCILSFNIYLSSIWTPITTLTVPLTGTTVNCQCQNVFRESSAHFVRAEKSHMLAQLNWPCVHACNPIWLSSLKPNNLMYSYVIMWSVCVCVCVCACVCVRPLLHLLKPLVDYHWCKPLVTRGNSKAMLLILCLPPEYPVFKQGQCKGLSFTDIKVKTKFQFWIIFFYCCTVHSDNT